MVYIATIDQRRVTDNDVRRASGPVVRENTVLFSGHKLKYGQSQFLLFVQEDSGRETPFGTTYTDTITTYIYSHANSCASSSATFP